jgi:hypothetical protein
VKGSAPLSCDRIKERKDSHSIDVYFRQTGSSGIISVTPNFNLPKISVKELTHKQARLNQSSFVLQLPEKKFDVHPKYLTAIQRNDGYNYTF